MEVAPKNCSIGQNFPRTELSTLSENSSSLWCQENGLPSLLPIPRWRWSMITKRSLLTCGRPKCWLNSNALGLVVVTVTKLKSPSGEQPTKGEKLQMSATRLPPLQQHPPPLLPSGGAVVTEEYHQFMLAQSSQTQEHN